MRALAVFHSDGAHFLAALLKKGFRHVHCCLDREGAWIMVDFMGGMPNAEVVAAFDYPLAEFYRDEGYIVIETYQRRRPSWFPLSVNNCVGLTKTMLCIRAPLVVTPYGLYRHLVRRVTDEHSSGV